MKYYLFVIFVSLICFSSCERKSGRINRSNKDYSNTRNPKISRNEDSPRSNGSNIIKMRRENGIFLVPTKINGVSLEFIFDTGASIISISQTEALFLYKQGRLTKEDFIGEINFTDANGDISEGQVVNLKTVEIGNRTLNNVQASIVNNLKAPLLLGQSALNRFGKISIDYAKSEITFE